MESELNLNMLLELSAEKWVQNGFCLGRSAEVDTTIFLHGALPGERVRARIVKIRATHAFAIAEEILSPSPERRISDCEAFPACGGCSFRHMDYLAGNQRGSGESEAEFELKVRLLSEQKFLQACLDESAPELFYAEPLAYRNHVQIQFQLGESGVSQDRGFFSLHSNQLIPLPTAGCANLSPELNSAIQKWIPPRPGKFIFREIEGKIYLPEAIEKADFLSESYKGQDWLLPAGGFFQSNRFLWPRWLEFIENTMTEFLNRPGISKPDTLELFSGSSLIGGVLRDKLGRYKGLESSKTALKAARKNFKHRKLEGDFLPGDLYRSAPDFQGTELVISNPPRAGMKKQLVQACVNAEVPTVLYSSCSPATLNRDLGIFRERGYKTLKTGIFDFFPRTPHLEVVILLHREI